jgi:hypothetical protein
MIRFTRNGLELDGVDWTAADPGNAGIRVQFQYGINVYVTRDFLEHALELIKFDDERRAEGRRPNTAKTEDRDG